MTNRELIAEIRKLAVELNGDTEGLPALSKLRKPALEQLLSGLRLNLAARQDTSTDPREEAALDAFEADMLDESVNDQVEANKLIDQAADNEAIRFMRVLASGPVPMELPVTETDVAVARVQVVAQLGSKLYDSTLISVTNRRTQFLPAILATVEFPDGIRRLIKADHLLAA